MCITNNLNNVIFNDMEHINKIAVNILKEEYSDYEYNTWHYDREYKMIVKAIEQVKNNVALDNVVGRSEQLFCPNCRSKNILIPGDTNDYQCIECTFEWAK